MNRSLAGRIGRLERRHDRRPFPRRVFGIYDHSEDEVFGVEADGVTVLRAACRLAWPRLHHDRRAMPVQPLYGSPERHRARRRGARYPKRRPAPDDAPRPIPGIGREATRDELVRMRAISAPPSGLTYLTDQIITPPITTRTA